MRLILDRALEQQVAAGAGGVVVLERAEVEHLGVVAEVDGHEIALRVVAREQRLAAQSRVVAAERHRRRMQRGVSPDVGALQRDLPRVRPVLLDRQVPEPGVVADQELDHGVDEMTGGADLG